MFRVEFPFQIYSSSQAKNQNQKTEPKNSMTDNFSERNKSCLNKLQKKGYYNKTNQNNKIL